MPSKTYVIYLGTFEDWSKMLLLIDEWDAALTRELGPKLKSWDSDLNLKPPHYYKIKIKKKYVDIMTCLILTHSNG